MVFQKLVPKKYNHFITMLKSLKQIKQRDSRQAAGFSNAPGSNRIQAKLIATPAHDRFEQEAERVADSATVGPQNRFIQNKLLQPSRLPQGENNGVVEEGLTNDILSTQGRGRNLDYATGSFLSRKMGADFTKVSIHTDSKAEQLNKQLNARAFTVGNDIYFNSGKYAPETGEGRHLLAHELAHTVQQNAAPVAVQKQDNEGKTFAPKLEIDFKVLPPDLQLRLFHFLLQADTGKVHLDYETKSFMAGLSYSYGDALSLKMRFTDFTTRLGWKPGDNTFSFGLSHGAFNANANASPFQSKYGLNLTYGAPLLPMFGDMSKNFMAGGTSAGNMITGIPSLPNDPVAWYQQYKPDIENISKSADLVKQITDAGKNKIRFGAGFSLTYDPDSQLVIGTRAGIMF